MALLRLATGSLKNSNSKGFINKNKKWKIYTTKK